MPLTIIERIAIVLFERLQALYLSDYATYVQEVLRPTRSGFTPKDGQVVLTQGDSVVVPELSYPGNPPSVARRVTFNIRCHVMSDETSDIPIDTFVNAFADDVNKAVTSTSSTWHTFDGLAVDAVVLDHEYVSGDGGPDGINVPIAITYRTDEDDFTQVRG